jgi:hypothetical protein
MRTMTKSATNVRYAPGVDTSSMARAASIATSASAGSSRRPHTSLAERLKTFLDRTLDAARGRYDM